MLDLTRFELWRHFNCNILLCHCNLSKHKPCSILNRNANRFCETKFQHRKRSKWLFCC